MPILRNCISTYPAPIDQANLRQMPKLARRFGSVPGLFDHTLGTTALVAAVALGACLIEKHFIISRADKGPDSEFSLQPADLERLCRDAKCAWLALGRAGFQRQEAEAANAVFRRSIYVTADLQSGDVLTREDLCRIRPGFGLPPNNYEQLLGKRMNALSELYKSDFHAWALQAAELVRQHKFDELNIEDLADELDSMGKKERAELANRLVILLAHLLKWQYQPAYRSASWRGSLIEQRKQILRQLQQSPSLKPYFPEAMADAYPDAVDLASRETLLSAATFPADCPYSEQQVLDYDFYPG